jgi:NAD(P)-dependent dehydrogenase (short-subunit alcohol dehydrogenase family)
MKLKLKPIRDQVMVITGASSGIGLVTAQEAARRGAKVVLAARNDRDLRRAVEEIRDAGGRAEYEVADVADAEDVREIAARALDAFGRIDTWVNNAAVALFGRLDEVPVEDMRRQFEVNFWGAVFGSLTAVPHLRRHGGALINVTSALSDRDMPMQGIYCASKHALKAFTDSLRTELEEAGVPISVTLVRSASVDTPFYDKARTYLGAEPQPKPPVYAPEAVARALLTVAEHPHRDVKVGATGKLVVLTEAEVGGRHLERTTFNSQLADVPFADRPDNLHDHLDDDGGERGRYWRGKVRERSRYTDAALNPGRAAMIAAAAGLALFAGARRLRKGSQERPKESRDD